MPQKIEIFTPGNSHLKIPVIGSPVKAGFPSPADDFLEENLDLNRYLISNPNSTFIARVKGESMTNANINDGDVLIVDRSLSWKKGSRVICGLNGEFTLKTLEKDIEGYYLQTEAPPSDNYPQKIRIREEDDVIIWGVVTYIIHKA